MRKRDLIIQNDRLLSEVSYLRGRLAELEKAPTAAIGHVESIVTKTLGAFLPVPSPEPDIPLFNEPQDPGRDWTDHLSQPHLSTQDLEELADDWNDRLEIMDELDRD